MSRLPRRPPRGLARKASLLAASEEASSRRANFPADQGMCSYPVMWNAFKRIRRRFGSGRREKTAPVSGAAKE